MIEFLCPNGHRIRCPAERAGKPAKCPKCGVKFLIPTLEEIQAAQGYQPQPNAVVTRDTSRIQFLCPNGHRLFGSADLQGRPGQCPECGVRFRIPVIEELPESQAEGAIPLSTVADSPSEPQLVKGMGLGDSAIVPESGIHLELSPRSAGDSRTPEGFAADIAGTTRPVALADLFQRLWTTRSPGSAVQIQLEDGQTLKVSRFRPISQNDREYGAFIVENSPFGPGLVIIPWRCVRVVFVSDAKEFPPQLFT